MKFQYLVLFLLFIFFLPKVSFAGVRINEIAWMGTANSANDEWIELYNEDSSTVDLSNWLLLASDGAPNLVLTGSISGNSYFLLERTDDSSVSMASADQIYTGALGNDGESLTLKDSTGSVQDTVNHSDGWKGGDNSTKDTMQYSNSHWITASATPRTENESSESEDTGEENKEDQSDSNNSNELETESANSVYDEEKDIIDTFTLNLQIDPVIISNVHAKFVVGVYKNNVRQLKGIHSWNFGDGAFVQNVDRYSRDDMTFSHVYYNPGTYVAIFEYRTSSLKKDPDVHHRVTITVTDHNVEISNINPNDSITLTNLTSKEVDVGGWQLRTNDHKYTFPDSTIILSQNDLVLSYQTLGILLNKRTMLFLPNGTMVSFLNNKKDHLIVQPHQNTFETIEPIKIDDSIVIRPLNETATVMFARDPIKQKGSQSNVWYIFTALLALGGVIGLSSTVMFLYTQKTKTSTSDDIEVDDITILED